MDYCTDGNIVVFLFLLTNVLLLTRFGSNCLLNAKMEMEMDYDAMNLVSGRYAHVLNHLN